MPYAAQAMGIATACVGGVGIGFTGLMYVSGINFKEQAEISTVQEALRAANKAGGSIGAKLRRWGQKNLPNLSTTGTGARTDNDP
jgi:hypothetical protein